MSEIKFDKRNYRKHNQRNKELIKKSLEECGEIWVDVKGYEGLYKVSNKGRIKSLARGYKNQYGEFGAKKEFIKTQKLNCFNKENKQERGYYVVNLARDDRGKWIRVHRLVAEAFIPNPEDKKEVNHKDGNKLNNNVSNLEWVTHQENCFHAWRTGLRADCEEERRSKIKEKNKKLKTITKDMVLDIFKNCVFGDKKYNAHHFVEKYNISLQTVCNIKNLKNETYKKIVREELCK